MTRRVRLLVDIAAAVMAGGIAYCVAIPRGGERLTRAPHGPVASDANDPQGRGSASAPRRASTRAALAIPDEPVDAGVRIEERRAMQTLRNEAIRVSSEDMHRRGVSVLQCLDGVAFAGAEKLRFAAEVVSTPEAATIRRWRFVEVADGEPVPESFAACASSAFGGGQHVVAAKDFPFPDYTGDVLILYTIPAPASK